MSVFSTTDTIVAVATPAGRGGLGVVRLSGAESLDIGCRLLRRNVPLTARRATVGHIADPDSVDRRTVDEVVATWFKAPHSYTREDVVEISAHGSPLLLRRIVELAIRAGARLAEPGEFTLRAYLNGRLDLVQAEAVIDLVNAVTPLQARVAMDQLEGTLTRRIAEVSATLFDLMARLEASIDFPEEGFHFVTPAEVQAELAAVDRTLTQLRGDGRAGRLLREGALVVISGRPNAGKSSLFNALVGAGRAIVTDVPGTTRDTLTELVDIGGLPITLVDTAGLREPADAIEAEGVRRARDAQSIAALSLVVLDGSAEFGDDDRAVLAACPRRIVAMSKSDLPAAWKSSDTLTADDVPVAVSTVTGEGIAELRARIGDALAARDVWRDPPAISNVRHLALVERATAAVQRVQVLAQAGTTEELLLAEMADATAALEEITGQTTSEDRLRHIFQHFCVGK
jgi:tRNA modification GTPase